MGKGNKLTIDIVKERLKTINPNIEILGEEYVNNSTKMKCRCLIDMYEWEATWSNLSSNHGCPKCGNSLKLTLTQVKERLREINPNIEILSTEYVNANKKLKCNCLVDNYKFETTWGKLSQGRGCPKCGGSEKLTLNEVKDRLYIINPNIEILSKKYINAQTKLKCRCTVDNKVWEVNWNNLSNGKGCPECANKVRNLLTKLTLQTIKERLYDINPNIEILSDEYISNGEKLKCKCKIDDCEWEVNWNNLSNGNGCPECKARNMRGENHPGWKGGITPLHNHLRNVAILQWKKDSFKQYNYKCNITQSNKDLIIHHLYNFSDILKETMDVLDLAIYQEIGRYTQKEIEIIENKCLELHYKHGLGVCLNEDIHKLFHKINGSHDNSFGQFEEFKKRYYNGEFDNELEEELKSYNSIKRLKELRVAI